MNGLRDHAKFTLFDLGGKGEESYPHPHVKNVITLERLMALT